MSIDNVLLKVVLVTEGSEEIAFKNSRSKGKSIVKNIMAATAFALYQNNPRMVIFVVYYRW